MSTYAYKGYNLVDPSESAASTEWGNQENTVHLRHITWIGADCVSDEYSAAGHKHKKMYDTDGDTVINADSSSTLVIGDTTRKLDVDISNNSSEAILISDGNSEILKYDSTQTKTYIAGSGGHSLYIGNENAIIQELVKDNVTTPYKLSVGSIASSEDVISVNTINGSEYVDIGANGCSNPLRHDSDSDIYTRERFSVDHTTKGFSSLTYDSVTAKMIGSDIELTIDIEGTSNSNQFYVELPFALEEGENANGASRGTLGLLNCVNNGTNYIGRTWFAAAVVSESNNRLVFAQWDGVATAWETYGTKGIYGKLRFRVADPEFDNTAPAAP